MRVIAIFGTVVLILFAAAAIILTASTIHHNRQLRKEARQYLPSRRLVQADGKKLHVYSEGEGDLTLVFMSGHGTSSPTLDFKPLWMRMVDDYRIAVVERSGYGWSATSNSPRDIDTLLEETRKALALSGEQGPYVLFAHSMSGLEAIRWAQKYPEEVKAIIGLDPCTPETFDILPEPNRPQLYTMYLVSRIGLSRYMPESQLEAYFPLIKSEDLTEEDKREYLAVFYKSAYSRDMLREVTYNKDNAGTVAESPIPVDTPMYFFISDAQEASVAGWQKALSGYLSQIAVGKYMQLDAGHYVHYEHADVIAEEARAFLVEVE